MKQTIVSSFSLLIFLIFLIFLSLHLFFLFYFLFLLKHLFFFFFFLCVVSICCCCCSQAHNNKILQQHKKKERKKEKKNQKTNTKTKKHLFDFKRIKKEKTIIKKNKLAVWVDVLVPLTLKTEAKFENSCESQKTGNHQVVERKLRSAADFTVCRVHLPKSRI